MSDWRVAGCPATTSGAANNGVPTAVAANPLFQQLPGTEVGQQQPAVAVAHHVVGLHVPMEKAGAMHGGQCASELHGNQDDAVDVERTVLAQLVLERRAVHELHPHADAAVDPLGAVDGDDVRVTDARQQAPFLDHRRRIAARFGRRRILRATSRSSRVSQARYTSPNVPRPTCSMMRSGPHCSSRTVRLVSRCRCLDARPMPSSEMPLSETRVRTARQAPPSLTPRQAGEEGRRRARW